MDRAALIDACEAITLKNTSELGGREAMEGLIRRFLDAVAQDRRELDDWEKDGVAFAIRALRQGAHHLAWHTMMITLAPESIRSPRHVADPAIARMAIADFRLELQRLSGEPLGPWAKNREVWQREIERG